MIVQYRNESGMCIVKIAENRFYYGDGKTVNAIGTSANQFLRFNPYMDYVEERKEEPSNIVKKWIMENVKERG